MRALFLVTFALLTGCISHMPMEEQSPDLAYLDTDKLVISVIDERWQLEKGKLAEQIGVTRNSV